MEKALIVVSVMLRTGIKVIDTGFLRSSPRDALQDVRYEDLKFNADRLKLIQIGFSFSDKMDAYVSASSDLLTRNGIDMEKNLREGVDPGIFSGWFTQILIRNPNMKWITFHGFYDLGYLMKTMMRNALLPNSLGDFLKGVRVTLRKVYYVKYMSWFCNGLLGRKLGLKRLGSIMNVERVRISHQAGSDSLLTLSLYLKMRKQFNMIEEPYEGFLDGIDMKIPVLIPRSLPQKRIPILFPSPMPVVYTQYPVFPSPLPPRFF
ncbi:hypothetical protein GIB67_023978 [Kingdonia uniflora]|uniref:Uncharacterized protein n=1 Tax=Kingdonia uniflora TaxID=39325 RepID=A0A7J7LPQ8_9MAGN|nr:hypothetical protein GIB67_023978 [Kingdonia uniflora]